jgi:hypothetical protein
MMMHLTMKIATQDLVNEVGIVGIGGFMAMDEDSCFDNVNMLEDSFTPMGQTLAHLHKTMAEITTECTTGVTSNCVTMQHHFFKELDQTFTTFVWLKSMNPCTQEWYFIGWMMGLGTPLTG